MLTRLVRLIGPLWLRKAVLWTGNAKGRSITLPATLVVLDFIVRAIVRAFIYLTIDLDGSICLTPEASRLFLTPGLSTFPWLAAFSSSCGCLWRAGI